MKSSINLLTVYGFSQMGDVLLAVVRRAQQVTAGAFQAGHLFSVAPFPTVI